MKSILISLIEKLLRGPLTPEEKNRLVVHILDKEHALPIRGIIYIRDGGLFINGEPVDYERVQVLRHSAAQVLENRAFRLCADQVRYLAVEKGLSSKLLPDDLLFYRAALWYADEMRKHLAILAQTEVHS